ncbi:MAG: Ig-like domain-containing protein [Bacteroidales bacterium]|nr:Ig-like domain-containing protein [Porphyromonas sp.]MDD6934191.1 Ig-like domain-containing protein [Bacteroidales bacterium]MDY3102168.1 Ig-like domain-containing protein [Porphyromonas sp.]
MNKMKTWLSLLGTAMMMTLVSIACFGCNPKNNPTPGPNPGPNPDDPSGVTSLQLSATELTLKVNETKQLTVVLNADAKIGFVTWTSDNESVASVTADGTVVGVAEGNANITASAGSARGVCKVQVKGTKQLNPIQVTMTGKIDHQVFTPGQGGKVSFDRFPVSVAEFIQVREQIGTEPQGAVALEVMAMEMYRRNRNIGLECLKLCNTSTNVNSCVGRLKELFGKDVNYARPYQMAAFLEGATPENGYNPTEPYTVSIQVRENRPYQDSGIFQTKVLAFWIECGGSKPGSKRGIEVLKTKKPNETSKGKYFIVFNCPDLYFQVEPISFDATFNGLK